VQTPEVIAFDDSLTMLPVPFAIIRRIRQSTTLYGRGSRDVSLPEAWKAVGREVALVHQVRQGSSLLVQLREFRQSSGVDPLPWVDGLVERGALGAEDDGWLQGLLDSLASRALADVPLTLCHGDINASNVLVSTRSGRFLSLIDWAGAGWLDPVWDFAGVSLDAVPFMLAGHREVAPMPQDHTAEARIFWCQAQTRLSAAREDASEDGARDQLVRHLAHLRRYVERVGLQKRP
jgi:thiamine kinase-like enzyme